VVITHDHAPVQIAGGLGGHDLVAAAGHDAAALGFHDQENGIRLAQEALQQRALAGREEGRRVAVEDGQTAIHVGLQVGADQHGGLLSSDAAAQPGGLQPTRGGGFFIVGQPRPGEYG